MKYDWSKETLESAINKADSYSETLRVLEIPLSGRNLDTLKSKIKQYSLDVSHFTFKSGYSTGTENKKYVPASTYLHKDSYITPYKLKEKLFSEGIKERKCETPGCTCTSGTWLGKPIVYQLHHKDGDNTNNELSNLQILCPNCHSQTDNYCGKSNKKAKTQLCPDCGNPIAKGSTYCAKCSAKHHRKVLRPEKETLIRDVKEQGSISAVGRKYGVTDSSVRKWLTQYDLPNHIKELKDMLLLDKIT